MSRREPSYNCPDSCMGQLGCQCGHVSLRGLEPKPRIERAADGTCGNPKCGSGYCDNIRRRAQKSATLMSTMDIYGRGLEAWDYGLPHSKCSCAACASWRAANWHRLQDSSVKTGSA